MMAGLAPTSVSRSFITAMRSPSACSAFLRAEMSAHEPTISSGRPWLSWITRNVSWIQM